MSKVRPTETNNATQFKAESWTIVSGPKASKELWATIMLDGEEKGWPCAFGPKSEMESYAHRLNGSKGKL